MVIKYNTFYNAGLVTVLLMPITVSYVSMISGAGFVYLVSLMFLIIGALGSIMSGKKLSPLIVFFAILVFIFYNSRLGLGNAASIVMLVILTLLNDGEKRKAGFLICGVLVASLPLAIYQYITNSWPILDQLAIDGFGNADHFNRAAGMIGHPIPYGIALGAAFLFYAIHGKYLLSAAAFIGVLLTQSRTAIISLAVITFALYIHRIFYEFWKGKLSKLNVVFISFSPIIILVLVLAVSLNSRYANILESYSYKYRYQQFDIFLNYINESDWKKIAIGSGSEGSLDFLGTTYRYGLLQGPPTFDNSILTIIFDFGVIGIVLIILTAVLVCIKNRSIILTYLLICSLSFDAYKWPVYILMCAILSFDLRKTGNTKELYEE